MRRSILIVFCLLLLGFSAAAQPNVLGRHPADRVLDSFWRQNTNANSTVLGINQNATVPFDLDAAVMSEVKAAIGSGGGSVPDGVLTNEQTGVTLSGSFTGAHSGDGGSLTNLDGSQILTGIIPIARMPNGLVRTNENDAVTITNTDNVFRGTFTGDGSALTGLSASALATGMVPISLIPNGIVRTNENDAVTITNADNVLGGALTGTFGGQAALTNSTAYGGFSSYSTGELSQAIGPGAYAASNSVAYGAGATALGWWGVAIGNNSSNQWGGSQGTAVGYEAKTSGAGTAVGFRTRAGGAGTVIGNQSSAGDFAVAVGKGLDASGESSVAIGAFSLALGSHSVVIGELSAALHDNSVVLANNTLSTADNQIMMGNASHHTVFPGNATIAGVFTNTSAVMSNVVVGTAAMPGNWALRLTTNLVSVIGAGNTTNNGLYVWNSDAGAYTNEQFRSYIVYENPTWYLRNPGGSSQYSSSAAAGATWNVVSGSSPAPTAYWGAMLNGGDLQVVGWIQSTNLAARLAALTNALGTAAYEDLEAFQPASGILSNLASDGILPFIEPGTGVTFNTNGNVLTINSTGGGGSGSVTSVGLQMPAQFSVSSTPITGSGTLGVSWQNQSANRVLAGPASGGSGQPTFRALVEADIPQLSYVTTTDSRDMAWTHITVTEFDGDTVEVNDWVRWGTGGDPDAGGRLNENGGFSAKDSDVDGRLTFTNSTLGKSVVISNSATGLMVGGNITALGDIAAPSLNVSDGNIIMWSDGTINANAVDVNFSITAATVTAAEGHFGNLLSAEEALADGHFLTVQNETNIVGTLDGGALTNLYHTEAVLATTGNATNYTVSLLGRDEQTIFSANTNANITFSGITLGRSVQLWVDAMTSSVPCIVTFPSGVVTNSQMVLTVTNGTARIYDIRPKYGTDSTNVWITAGDVYQR